MISKQTSEALARSYRPLDATAYLRVHGWKQSHVIPDRYSLWTKPDAIRGNFEVLVPEMLDAADLRNRVAELMTTLAVEEGRALDEVAEDIATPNCDVVRAGLRDESEGATLSLENGAEVFRNIYDLLLAAGCSAWKPRAAYGPRKPDELKKAGDQTDRITLTGTVNGERRTVLALLDGEARLLANQAFQERRPVTCVGELVKEGRLYQLRNPRSFAILADEE